MGRTTISGAAMGGPRKASARPNRRGNRQKLGYSIRRTPSEPQSNTIEKFVHMFFCRCEAPARRADGVGVMPQAEGTPATSSSVRDAQHRAQWRKVHPALALGHGLRIKLRRRLVGGASHPLVDQEIGRAHV